jgi:hypothetical protein
LQWLVDHPTAKGAIKWMGRLVEIVMDTKKSVQPTNAPKAASWRSARCVCVVLALLFTVILVASWWLMLPPHQTVLRNNFERVEQGMTPEQVKEVFGGKPNAGSMDLQKYETMSWTDGDDIATISFALDAQGPRAAKGFRHMRSDGFLGKLLESILPDRQDQIISWE